jgi:predicted dehydrogenase
MKAEPIGIGFVGLGFGGYIAETVLTGPAREFFSIEGVCDADQRKAAEFGERHGLRVHRSLDDLLADDAIAAVALFSEPHGRAALLSRIIRAGKDVITTKPFELDPISTRKVFEEAGSLGRVIHVNSPGAKYPAYLRQMQQWRDEYDLGRPVGCRGEMLVSYREKADGRWLDDPTKAPAAPLFRLGIYVISDMIRLFGRVAKVQTLSSRLFTERPTADNAQLNLLFENGALGNIYATFGVDNGQHYAGSLIFHFERGTIYRNMSPVAYGQAEGSSRLSLVTCGVEKQVITREFESQEASGSYQWEAFHAAITGSRPVRTPAEDITHGVEILEAMARSEKSGATEAILKY